VVHAKNYEIILHLLNVCRNEIHVQNAWYFTVCDFLFFFCFFRFCTSPTGRHGWPIFTMYTSNDAFSCKEVPFGVSMMNFHIYPRFSPKIWKFALWPMATSNGNNSATLKIEARCLYHIGGSGVGQFSGVDEICLRPTPVTMATNWRFLSAKLAKTRLIH